MLSLENILFTQGFGTRKQCRVMVGRGSITVQGEPCRDADQRFAVTGDPALAFTVDSAPWQYHAKAYVLMNKPAGYECSHKPGPHPSMYELLPPQLVARNVQAIGRLDHDTTGLLLMSDDGQFIHKMSSPKHNVPKIYEVSLAEPITPTQLAALLKGVVLDDDPVPVAAAGCVARSDKLIALTLTTGKYHQVKRMLAAVGNHVVALQRSQIGGLQLPADLPVGQWRWLTSADLAQIRQ